MQVLTSATSATGSKESLNGSNLSHKTPGKAPAYILMFFPYLSSVKRRKRNVQLERASLATEQLPSTFPRLPTPAPPTPRSPPRRPNFGTVSLVLQAPLFCGVPRILHRQCQRFRCQSLRDRRKEANSPQFAHGKSIPGCVCIFETRTAQAPDVFCETCSEPCQCTMLPWRRDRTQSHLQRAPSQSTYHVRI